VPAARQRAALNAVLDTLKVDALAIPPRILESIPPRAFAYGGGTTELFPGRTDPTFDPIAAATIASDLAISALLQHERAARLIEFHSHNPANPDFKEVVDALIARTWKAAPPANAYHQTVARAVESITVTRLMDLSANPDASPQVRAVASDGLRQIAALLNLPSTPAASAHRRAVKDDIERFLTRPDAPRRQTVPLPPPAGDPIGANQ
ncbi:MAG TPA: zinc-dependent metalloprotease, partial [Blastocatellia bacterium]|nr:zinc-dependent metalloprotease [Blastocatellia bacterium]